MTFPNAGPTWHDYPVIVAPRGLPSIRVALAILVGVNTFMAFWTYRRYQTMLDYCAGFSQPDLQCFSGGPLFQLWEALFFELGIWFVLEVAALVLLGAAIVNWGRLASHLARPS